MTTILVAYASKHHATAEIAYRIGAVLRKPTVFQVDVRAADTVTTLEPYNAIILGSAVYMGQWQPEAADFLKRFEVPLMGRPTWLFSSGPTGEGDPAALMKGWAFPENLRPLTDRIQPRDIALFHGKLDTAQLNFLERAAIKMVKAPVGDYREWETIDAWADSIAQALAQHAKA